MGKIRRIKKTSPLLRPVLLDPKDIRIGNILKMNKDTLIVSVDNIGDILHNLYRYNPVLITDEILINSGLRKEQNSYKYYIDYLDGYYYLFSGKMGMFCKVDRGSLGYPTRYVHHLQNMYYVITGEELQVII